MVKGIDGLLNGEGSPDEMRNIGAKYSQSQPFCSEGIHSSSRMINWGDRINSRDPIEPSLCITSL